MITKTLILNSPHFIRAKSFRSAGFTITEIIVSMVVLGLILGGAVRTFGVALQLHEQNENRTTAAYLVQECLEIIRNNRDTNWLQNQAWDANITNLPAPFDPQFERHVEPKTLQQAERINPENPTGEKLQTEIEKEFTCTVTWNSGEQSISAAQILSNWQQ